MASNSNRKISKVMSKEVLLEPVRIVKRETTWVIKADGKIKRQRNKLKEIIT